MFFAAWMLMVFHRSAVMPAYNEALSCENEYQERMWRLN